MNTCAHPSALRANPVIAGRRSCTQSRRGGMTLVELLVVMAILSILSSLSLAGLAVARTSAKKAKTATTIRKISEIILPYYEEYETRRPVIDPAVATTLLARAGGRNLYSSLKRIATRRLMALELPERPADVLNAIEDSAGIALSRPVFSTNLGGVTVTLSETPPNTRRYYSLIKPILAAGKNVTSDELLHLIVTRGPVADPDIIAHFRDDETADTDNDGLLEFVDGWQRPIMFKRWPTGFKSPMQPIDGTERNIESLISDKGHRLVPLIYSAGVDGSYDIEAMTSLLYKSIDYDPFRFDSSAPGSPSASPINCGSASVRGEGVLVPTGSLPLTFTAQRYYGTPIAGSFQTVGCERDTGSAEGDAANGILESMDNIHNHDMTR